MSTRSNGAYSKTNCQWPLQRGAKGWRRVSLIDRYSSAIAHLTSTPKGSIYCDLDYGSQFFLMLTQGMNEASSKLVEADFKQAVARYIPDIVLRSMTVVPDHESETLQITIDWTIRGADSQIHGDLGQPRTTTVTI